MTMAKVAAGQFRAWLLEEARAEGFTLSATIDLEPALSPPGPGQPAPYDAHVARYDRWLEQGRHGEMHYLQRGRDRRADPRRLMPEAKAMLCVALPYPRSPAGAPTAEQGPRYARYLQGPDYHVDLAERLRRVMLRVRARVAQAEGAVGAEASAKPNRVPPPRPGGPADRVLRWKVCVDTSAVLERTWASLSGLGWIGKNTLLIHPKEGSYLFLGEVLLDRETGQGPAPLPNFCGHCTRCLDGCPTQAITAPGELDSRKCIAYATLEKRGDWPKETAKTASFIAGCDVCQEVCPFNRKASSAELSQNLDSSFPEKNPLDPTQKKTWLELLRETPSEYLKRVKHTALERIRPDDFSRNLAIALSETLASSTDWTAQNATELLVECQARLGRTDGSDAEALLWNACVQQFQEHLSRAAGNESSP